MQNNKENKKINGAEISGATFSDISIAGTFYNHDRYSTLRGHGFAAEDANHQYDLLHGKNAHLVGADNAKNGADRIVNGQYIQTKFCSSGSRSIAAAFENGRMKYIDPSGKPMQIEVPSDLYDSAVQAMQSRIKKGQVPGVEDPSEAIKIVRKSPFSYEQAKNIAKAGNIDSIKFDATNGMIISVSAFGISSLLSFASSVWNGDNLDLALQNSAASGLKVGGVSFASSVISAQLSKAGLNSALVSSSDTIVSIMGPKASAVLVNALRSGENIYGAAAMKSASKLLRGNIITGVVTGVILETVDFVNIFRGRISGKQLFKNVANTAAGIAGGTAGWAGGTAAAGVAGAAIGSFVPVIGTAVGGTIGVAVGGIIGAFGGGAAATAATNATLSSFIEDDANKMVAIVEKRFSSLAKDYLLSKKEAELVADELRAALSGAILKDMYAAPNHEKFADAVLRPLIEKSISLRIKIKSPTEEEMLQGMRKILEEVAHDEEKAEISAFYDKNKQDLLLTNNLLLIGSSVEHYLPLGFYFREELVNLYGLIDVETGDFTMFLGEKNAKVAAFELVNGGSTEKKNLQILTPRICWFEEEEILKAEKTWYVKIDYENHQYSFTRMPSDNAEKYQVENSQPVFVIDYKNETFYDFKDEKLAKVKIFDLVNKSHLNKSDFELVKNVD